VLLRHCFLFTFPKKPKLWPITTCVQERMSSRFSPMRSTYPHASGVAQSAVDPPLSSHWTHVAVLACWFGTARVSGCGQWDQHMSRLHQTAREGISLTSGIDTAPQSCRAKHIRKKHSHIDWLRGHLSPSTIHKILEVLGHEICEALTWTSTPSRLLPSTRSFSCHRQDWLLCSARSFNGRFASSFSSISPTWNSATPST